MTRALVRLWSVALGLAAGTVLGFERSLQPALLAIAALVCGTVMLRRRSLFALPAVVGVSLCLGALNATVRAAPAAITELARMVPDCRLEGRVLERSALGTFLAVRRADCDGAGRVDRAGSVVVDDLVAEAGETFEAYGTLIPLGSNGFDEARRFSGAHSSFAPDRYIHGPVHGAPLVVAAKVRAALHAATDGLDPARAGLLRGVTIGDTELLAAETVEAFRRSGLSHVLAVSGSNLAIVLGAVSAVAASAARRSRLMVSLAAMSLFVLVVGPDPSVLRAGAMGAITVVALGLGRRAEPLFAIALALIVVIALRPAMVFSVGLHLSAAATAGIVLWGEAIARRCTRVPRVAAMAIGATLSAQVAVAPILIATFGQLSLIGPVANVLALPAVPPATVIGLGSAAVELLHEGWGGAFARVAALFGDWILFLAGASGGQGWAAIEVPRWLGGALGSVVLAAGVRSAVRLGAPTDLSDRRAD
ncbi:MAG: ComEC/Rec2 family competence protein [Actinomycetota bacterium]|nr:ComEC/Rec2 family competence protein [Actinomycetota bacterium]